MDLLPDGQTGMKIMIELFIIREITFFCQTNCKTLILNVYTLYYIFTPSLYQLEFDYVFGPLSKLMLVIQLIFFSGLLKI